MRRALEYIEKCIRGESTIPDIPEVKPDCGLFIEIMLTTWLKIYNPEHERAIDMALRWARIIEETFAAGSYDQNTYERAYRDALRPKGKDVWYLKTS